MSNSFIPVSDRFIAGRQISPDDVPALKDLGVDLIINNRPEAETPGQPTGASIESAASAAGIRYIALPVGPAGVTFDMLEQFIEAERTAAKAFAFCASGTRSVVLRNLALAHAGNDPETLLASSANAGFDLEGQRPALQKLYENAQQQTPKSGR